MFTRHRLGVPALLVMILYLVALAGAVVVAMAFGDLGALRWLTLSAGPDEQVEATWPNVLLSALVGLVVAWGLWQALRGPLIGPPAERSRGTRWLRVALYVAAASTLVVPLLVSWRLWGALAVTAPMLAVAVLLAPVLGRSRTHAVILWSCGVLGYVGQAFTLGLVSAEYELGAFGLVSGLGVLIWNVLVLRAQWDDDRWPPATVKCGILALVLPTLGMITGSLIGVAAEFYDEVAAVGNALMVVWLSRSAHDLAAPRPVADHSLV